MRRDGIQSEVEMYKTWRFYSLAEAEALRFRVPLARNLESDNLALIRACTKETKIGEISSIIEDIHFINTKMEFEFY